jgi:hypothetical protein
MEQEDPTAAAGRARSRWGGCGGKGMVAGRLMNGRNMVAQRSGSCIKII